MRLEKPVYRALRLPVSCFSGPGFEHLGTRIAPYRTMLGASQNMVSRIAGSKLSPRGHKFDPHRTRSRGWRGPGLILAQPGQQSLGLVLSFIGPRVKPHGTWDRAMLNPGLCLTGPRFKLLSTQINPHGTMLGALQRPWSSIARSK